MTIKTGDRKNFQSLLTAASREDLALVESRDAKTGEYRALICAMSRNDDGTITPVPFGHMNLGNPFEDYLDPTLDTLPEAKEGSMVLPVEQATVIRRLLADNFFQSRIGAEDLDLTESEEMILWQIIDKEVVK